MLPWSAARRKGIFDEHPRSSLRLPPPQGGNTGGPAEPDPRYSLGHARCVRRSGRKEPWSTVIMNLMTPQHDAHEELAHKALRFLTAGSVDDGKSTLIGRLLFDSRAILADQLDALEKRAAGAPVDLSLLTDGLEA